MALDQLTWRASQVATFTAGATVADFLAAIKSLIDAEVAANPTTYHWEVSDYSAVNGTLELKPKSATISSARILLFGGSSPNAAALYQASVATNRVYCACAPTAGTTGPDNDYTSGNPYNTTNTLGISTFSTAYQSLSDNVRYFETEESICIVINDANGSSDMNFIIAGVIAEHPSDGRVYGVASHGAADVLFSASGWTAANADNRLLPTALAASGNSDYPHIVAVRSSPQATCFLAYAQAESDTGADDHARSFDTNTNYFFPTHVFNATDQEYVGIMRQIAFGNTAILGNTQLDSLGAIKAYAVSADAVSSAQAFWLTN